ncbi:MAG: hypothetical protein R6U50_18570 [Desulfobacterales bacterium]
MADIRKQKLEDYVRQLLQEEFNGEEFSGGTEPIEKEKKKPRKTKTRNRPSPVSNEKN